MIASDALVSSSAPSSVIVAIGLMMELFNSLQFSSTNSMVYADIDERDVGMASTIVSTLQQMPLSFGLACRSLVIGYFLADLPQTDHAAVIKALHDAVLTFATLTFVSSLSFGGLSPADGENISKGAEAVAAHRACFGCPRVHPNGE